MKIGSPLLLLLIFLTGSICPAADNQAGAKNAKELYIYQSVPSGSDYLQPETITIEITILNQTYRYLSRINSPDNEKLEITTNHGGLFIEGSRTEGDINAQKISKLWRKDNKVYLQKDVTDNTVKTYSVTGGKALAVDGSLLLLIRSYPFGRETGIDIFMVDFSGASVTVNLKETGRENIIVPAGKFECYRMEVTIDIPLLHPRITYWVTREPPHFLVKSFGRRGPFTAVYETSLVSAPLMVGK